MTNPASVQYGEFDCHSLKTWPEFFEPLLEGRKKFEVRVNDRDFQVGDYLWLREFDATKEQYTGRELVKRVSYLLDSPNFLGLSLGYVALSLDDVGESQQDEVIHQFARQQKHHQVPK